jgi:hypothetical protein
MKTAAFTVGVTFAAAGAIVPMILPALPSSIQTAPGLQQVGSFFIAQQNWIVIVGLVLIIVSLFL